MDGEHTLDQGRTMTEDVLHNVFAQLYTQRVMPEAMILKPNMVLPGLTCSRQGNADEVAEATIECLLRVLPASVPGMHFCPVASPVNWRPRA